MSPFLIQDMEYENEEDNGFRKYLDEKLFETGCWRHFITFSLSMLCFLTALTTYSILVGSSENFPDESFVIKSITSASRGDE